MAFYRKLKAIICNLLGIKNNDEIVEEANNSSDNRTTDRNIQKEETFEKKEKIS